MRGTCLIFSLMAGLLQTGISLVRGDTGQPPMIISPADPAAVQRGIDEACGNGARKVVIPAGVYRLAADPRSGAHLHFARMKDVEIDATGATLIFTTPHKGAFDFDHCENVTLRGATLLRDPMPFSQGRIVALGADRKTIDVQVDKGYPADFDDKQSYSKLFLNSYNGELNRRWQDDIWSPRDVERLGPDTFRFYAGRAVGADSTWKAGSAVAWRGWGGADIAVTGCQRMKIAGVTVKNGAGFCVSESGGEGGNYYSYTVTYGPRPPGATEEPILASNADAFHSNSVRKGPTLEDCHFEGMNDDGIPIHGQYALIERSEGRQIIVETKNHPFCQPGDRLRFLDEHAALAQEGKVVSIEDAPDYHPEAPAPHELRLFQDLSKHLYAKITLDQEAKAKFGWLAANADANGSGFVVRRCTIRNHRARGMLIKASDGLIEDCTVEGSSMGGIVISPEMGYWNESDFARNVIVRGNTIRDCDYWHQEGSYQAGALTLAASEYNHLVPLPGGHRHVLIENNTFVNNNGVNLVVSSAQDVIIRHNRFVHPMWEQNERGKACGINPQALIWLTECSGVELLDNLVSDPGPFLKSRVDATATAAGAGLRDGVPAAPDKP